MFKILPFWQVVEIMKVLHIDFIFSCLNRYPRIYILNTRDIYITHTLIKCKKNHNSLQQ